MGFWQRLGLVPRVWAPPTPEETVVPVLDYLIDEWTNAPVGKLFEKQPHLRTVTTFIARNVSSTSLHVYRRGADGGRERVRDSQLALLMGRPNRDMTMGQFLFAIVMDLCLYDEAIIHVTAPRGDGLVVGEMPELTPISPRWVTRQISGDRIWGLDALEIQTDRGRVARIPADQIIRLHGYSPDDYINGTSPVETLRDLLREQMQAAKYRTELWKNGPQISGVIERPQGVKWTPDDRKRFKASLRTQYTGNGSGVGGMPILEDGMTLKPFHLTAKDEQFVDVAKLSLQTVASVFHVNPVMVGLLDNANYSNVREFRRSLYGDSLGPIIKQIEEVFNYFLLPMLHIDASNHYVEFNLDEKLRASFEEKAAVTSTAVGGPWMTRNEARAMNNMPAIEGGDELIMPLNLSTQGAEDTDTTDTADQDGLPKECGSELEVK